MDLKLDDEMLKSVVSEAIVRALDEQKRDALIQGAIHHLLSEKRSGLYGTGLTQVQEAFNTAVGQVAMRIAEEKLASDPRVQEKIRSVINEALMVALEENRAETVKRVAGNIVSGLYCHRDRD